MAMLREPTILAQFIQAYARAGRLDSGKQLHARLIASGGVPSVFVANSLLNMYAKCGDLTNALYLFDEMPHKNLVTWTTMITGLYHNKRFPEAIRYFSLMCTNRIRPTQFAFSGAIQAAASYGSLEFGKQLHSLSLKSGFDVELFVGSNLANMYFKCNSLHDACNMFDKMPYKDEVSWTTLIDGYNKNGDFEKALVAFKKMVREGIGVDQYVLCGALSSCGGLKWCQLGKSLHSWMMKLGLESEAFPHNALTDMYSKSGDMDSTLMVIELDSTGWNVVSCSSLIDGYVETDQIEKALSMYVESQKRGVEPNEFTFSSMFKACARHAKLEQGTQLHAQVIKMSFIEDPFVCSALVDMYGKCGFLKSSIQTFDEMECPTDFTCNSLVGVFAQHGCGREAIEAFKGMASRGFKLNDITFVNLLTACSHSGLVDEGLEIFDSMLMTYGIEPKQEHYCCVIDLLGRAGRLKEAEEFISQMPFEPNAFGWCSLLGACKKHGNKVLGEIAAEKLMRLEPKNGGTHTSLSTIYASAGQWEDVKAVRRLMKDSGVRKLPGFSWVDVDNKTHVFAAEDGSHPQKKEIYEKLKELSVRIREVGYVPFTGCVSSNVEEGLKERILYHHSERIAVAFALISMPVTKPIIVKKNLRVCVDCHSAIKLISKVEGREIIIRDNARFHHFSNGLCSCGDYW